MGYCPLKEAGLNSRLVIVERYSLSVERFFTRRNLRRRRVIPTQARQVFYPDAVGTDPAVGGQVSNF